MVLENCLTTPSSKPFQFGLRVSGLGIRKTQFTLLLRYFRILLLWGKYLKRSPTFLICKVWIATSPSYTFAKQSLFLESLGTVWCTGSLRRIHMASQVLFFQPQPQALLGTQTFGVPVAPLWSAAL